MTRLENWWVDRQICKSLERINKNKKLQQENVQPIKKNPMKKLENAFEKMRIIIAIVWISLSKKLERKSLKNTKAWLILLIMLMNSITLFAQNSPFQPNYQKELEKKILAFTNDFSHHQKEKFKTKFSKQDSLRDSLNNHIIEVKRTTKFTNCYKLLFDKTFFYLDSNINLFALEGADGYGINKEPLTFYINIKTQTIKWKNQTIYLRKEDIVNGLLINPVIFESLMELLDAKDKAFENAFMMLVLGIIPKASP